MVDIAVSCVLFLKLNVADTFGQTKVLLPPGSGKTEG